MVNLTSKLKVWVWVCRLFLPSLIFLCVSMNKFGSPTVQHFQTRFYKRYVDDVFLFFKDQSDSTLFLDNTNGKHPNIDFSIVREVSGTLSFLNCIVTKEVNKLITSVYREPTISGLGISYLSFCASRFKNNAIKTLLCRT